MSQTPPDAAEPEDPRKDTTPPPHPYSVSEELDRRRRKARNRSIWIVAVIAIVVFSGAMAWNIFRDNGGDSAGEAQNSASSGEQAGSVGSGPFAGVEWPENMASGGVAFKGVDGVPTVVPTDQLPDGTPAPVANRVSGDHIIIYLDYRCPVCNVFEHTNSELLGQLASRGDVTVEYRPLTFLDRYSDGTYYSSRAANAMACIVSQQPEAAWQASSALFGSYQPEENTPGHDNDEITAHLDDAVGGLDPDVGSCIADETYVPFAQAFNDSVVGENASPVPDVNDTNTMVQGTPTVFVNGDPFTGGVNDAKGFAEFVRAQGIDLP